MAFLALTFAIMLVFCFYFARASLVLQREYERLSRDFDNLKATVDGVVFATCRPVDEPESE